MLSLKKLLWILLAFGLTTAGVHAQTGQPEWPLRQQKPYSLVPDLSFLNEKPAGAKGRVSAEGDKLIFEDGTAARFWGANLQANALFSTKPAHIKLQAKRLAALGFNLVRIHHHDSTWVRPNVFKDHTQSTRHLNLASMRTLDLWIEALKADGIYIWLDMQVGRRLVTNDNVDAFDDFAKNGIGWLHGLSYFSPSIQNLMKEFQGAYLGYENHLSGLRYADDPAVIAVLLTNENDLTHHYGNRLLPDKGYPHHMEIYLSAAQSFAQEHGLSKWQTWRSWEYGPSKIFLNDVEHHFFSGMSGDLRQLGYEGLIIPTNMWGKMPVSSLPSLSMASMIDVHSYGEAAGLSINPTKIEQVDVLSWVASSHVTNMPISISEWNVLRFPTLDRFLLPLRMATLAAHQGWDAPIIYGYAQQPLNGALIPSNWDVAGDPSMLSVLPASALMYRRQHVRPAEKTYALRLSAEQLFRAEISPKTSTAIRTLFEQSALVIEMPTVPELPWLRPRKAPPGSIIVNDLDRNFLDPDAHEVIADTGEFLRNFKDEIMRVSTDQTQLFAGRLAGQVFDLENIYLHADLPLAAVAVQSLDGQKIENSREILISLSTRTRLEKERPAIFAIEPAQGELRVKAVPGLTLRNLRGNPLPAVFDAGWYRIDLGIASDQNWLKLAE